MIPLYPEPDAPTAPLVALGHLDDLWFQLTGTHCNLTCNHCFISCSPHNDSFGYLTLAEVERYLAESVPLGVKEYYFTGGEPFLHRDIVPILERTLTYGPATVLTNGTVLHEEPLRRLARAEERSAYTLEFRVSIDGYDAATNDPVRGPGTFDRAMRGVETLLRCGFLPIITVTRTEDDVDDAELFAVFVGMLKEHGYARPRIKLLPTLRIGAEVQRQRGYRHDERVTPEMMTEFDTAKLVCQHSRIVTDRGVHVCPILIEFKESRLGGTLQEALGPYPLRHQACYTCYLHGSLCSNPSGGGRDA